MKDKNSDEQKGILAVIRERERLLKYWKIYFKILHNQLNLKSPMMIYIIQKRFWTVGYRYYLLSL